MNSTAVVVRMSNARTMVVSSRIRTASRALRRMPYCR
jgi:hypothetical protein